MGRAPPFASPVVALAMGLAALGGSPAAAAPQSSAQSSPQTCFRISQIESTRPDGDKQIYLRTSGNQVYRLDLQFQCATLRGSEGVILKPFGGNDVVCHPIDLDIAARNIGGGGAEPCVLKSITHLTPEEAAALPSKVRP